MTQTCPKCGWAEVAGADCPRCGVNVARYRAELAAAGAVAPPPALETRPAAPAPAQVPGPAGFWIRFAAFLVDSVVLSVATWALYLIGVLFIRRGRAVYISSQLFGFFLNVAYFVVLHWLWGQTLGKMALQIRVVTVNGSPLSFGRALGRYFAHGLSAMTLGIGYLMAGLRSDKRALHDLVAGTRVERLS